MKTFKEFLAETACKTCQGDGVLDAVECKACKGTGAILPYKTASGLGFPTNKKYAKTMNEDYWEPDFNKSYKSINDAVEVLIGDAEELEAGERDWIGIIRLAPDWKKKLSTKPLKAKWVKALKGMFSQFDSHHDHEEDVVDARYETAYDFLIANGLAKRVG